MCMHACVCLCLHMYVGTLMCVSTVYERHVGKQLSPTLTKLLLTMHCSLYGTQLDCDIHRRKHQSSAKIVLHSNSTRREVSPEHTQQLARNCHIAQHPQELSQILQRRDRTPAIFLNTMYPGLDVPQGHHCCASGHCLLHQGPPAEWRKAHD